MTQEIAEKASSVDLKDSNLGTVNAAETLLFVDDERNILSSLRRLFRPQGYTILLAGSGAEGLELLKQHPVDLIISDMRMPEMDGAQFLEEVARLYPDTVRILLTGFADLTSTIAAINKGKIYRYLAKPWEDTEITLAVQQALQTKRLEREKRELQALTERQNRELVELNESLEFKVRQRTKELQQTADMLDLAFSETREAYRNTMRVFAGLIAMREALSGRHSERIAELAKRLAQAMGLDEQAAEEVYFAALLHLLGKLGLPDSLVDQPIYALNRDELAQYKQHPIKAQDALLPVEALQGVANLIRSSEEHWDGKGFPDKLAGEAIPLGARVLAVARDYYGYQTGRLLPDRLSQRAAIERMQHEAGKAYDPAVVQTLAELGGKEEVPQDELRAVERKLPSDMLVPGMRLAKDLYSSNHTLLLTRGRVFTDVLIRKLIQLERAEKTAFDIHVFEEMAL